MQTNVKAKKEQEAMQLYKPIFRPWGYYICVNSGHNYLTKTICVRPKQKLSIQSHNFRSEHWIVLEGSALVLLNNKEYILNSGDSIDIPTKAKHSLQNPYNEELKLLKFKKESLSQRMILFAMKIVMVGFK